MGELVFFLQFLLFYTGFLLPVLICLYLIVFRLSGSLLFGMPVWWLDLPSDFFSHTILGLFSADVNSPLCLYIALYSGKSIPAVSVDSSFTIIELVSKPQVQLFGLTSLQGGCWPGLLAFCPPPYCCPRLLLTFNLEATAISVPAQTLRPRLI